MAEEGDSLESWLNKATNPANREDDWEYIMGFCDQVNKELEGPQISTKLIAHKIQSPQEKEALQALTVLEACVKNCGRRFHQEIGKFRFLNELIKLISPKYLGDKTADKVKTKVIELIYSWHMGLPHESKISDAYQMLKKQGIVTKDPAYIDTSYEPPPPPRPKNALFEDDDKAKDKLKVIADTLMTWLGNGSAYFKELLDRLLKSKNPEDLQAANRLIKNMVKEDSERMEKVNRRLTELETCNNNVKLLNEMLVHYRPGVTSSAELDLMKELYESCERMRPKLFTLASDTDDKDDELSDVLQANDNLVRVMALYKKVIIGEEDSTATLPGGAKSSLIDVDSVLLSASGEPFSDTPSALSRLTDSQNGAAAATPSNAAQKQPVSSSAALLEDQLSSLGLNDSGSKAQNPKESYSSDLSDLLGTASGMGVPGFPNQQQQQPTSNPTIASTTQSFPNHQPHHPGAQPFTHFPPQQQNFGAFGSNAMSQPVPMGAMGGMAMGHNAVGGPTHGFGPMPVRPLTNTSSSMPRKPPPPAAAAESKPSPFDDLDVLGKSMIETSKAQKQTQQAKEQIAKQQQISQPAVKPPQASPLVDIEPTKQPPAPQPMQKPATQPVQQATPQPAAVAAAQTAPGSPGPGSGPSTPKKEVLSIADIVVPLETIQPGVHAPLTVYDKNNIRSIFHFAKNSPRPDILVVVISTMSSNTSAVKNVVFQAAVPKVMKVKLQPPSASELPAFNPILPPAAITQVMLLANPNKERVRLKYKMTYTLNDQPVTEVGEVNTFPMVAS